jgi:enolase
MAIKSITPEQILNSQGHPTLKVKMTADNGMSSYFVVSSGTSIGNNEAQKKTDATASYDGKSVNACIDLINKVIAPKFIGYPLDHQQDFDSLLIALDGTENKQNLGANTILAMSGAYFKLSAKLSKKPLWQYIAEKQNTNPRFPRIFANIIAGGKHAPGLDIQEFMIIPKSEKPVEAIEQIVQIYNTVKTIMISLYGPTARLVSEEGAIAPVGARTEVVLEALANLNSKLTNKFDIALDIAANSFFDGQQYSFEGQNLHASDLLKIYQQFETKFDIYSLEDPFAEKDIEGIELLKTMPKDKKSFKVISDDYTATNPKLITQFGQDKIFDGIIIKPDQVGSISEMFSAVNTAKQLNQEIIISHRSGESNDGFIVDLAYGLGADGIKIGAPARGERIAKYNRLLEIQYSLESLQTKAPEPASPQPTLIQEQIIARPQITEKTNLPEPNLSLNIADKTETKLSSDVPVKTPPEPINTQLQTELQRPIDTNTAPPESATSVDKMQDISQKNTGPSIENVTTSSNQEFDHFRSKNTGSSMADQYKTPGSVAPNSEKEDGSNPLQPLASL